MQKAPRSGAAGASSNSAADEGHEADANAPSKERVEQLSGARTREQRKHVTQVRARMTGQRHVSAFAPYAACNPVEGLMCPAPVGEHRLRENGGPR